MPKSRAKHRPFKLINFKVYYDTDMDILEWWQNIEEGDRSDALRDMIRERITGKPVRRRGLLDSPELAEMHRDTLWIKDTLNEMPALLEQLVQHVTTSARLNAGQPIIATPQITMRNEPALTHEDAERRTKRMRKATW